MPLFLEGQELKSSCFKKKCPITAEPSLQHTLKKLSEDWSSKSEVILDENVLHVSQREYGVIDPKSKGDIAYIATDSATTCHVLVLIHPEHKVIGLAHFDGSNTNQGTADLLKLMECRVSLCKTSADSTSNAAPSRYELYMFGGFNDEKGTSDNLSVELLTALHRYPQQLDIKVLCIGSLNSCYRNGICFPIYYGAGVNCDTLEILRIQCKDRGPVAALKGCRNFVGPKKMNNCYDNMSKQMIMEPFNYRPIEQVDRWLEQSDAFLLKYLSTSPEQEPAHFIESVKQSLRIMLTHPLPLRTIFKDNKILRFKLTSGYWKDVDS